MAKYNFLLMLSWLLILPVAVIRLCTRKDTIASLRARLALGYGKKPKRKTIWCHAASVGEFNTLETLIPTLKESFSEYDILISVSNIIAYAQAKAWVDRHVYLVVAPLDFKLVIRRFINHWSPIALITIENEMFPNRIVIAKSMGLEIIWVNARMSDKSLNFWLGNVDLKNKIVGKIDHVFAQDRIAYERFLAFGISGENLTQTENLKKFCAAPPVTHPDLQKLKNTFSYYDTLCAASTHHGEDQIILDAFQIALRKDSSLKLILVPRHPKRSPEIRALLHERGLHYTTRSQGELPQREDQVYLADTIGELSLWYSASATTFVAGSILPIGGHTPFEPAAYGSAIIHGPHFSNFQDIYKELDQGQGAFLTESADEISTAWEKLRTENLRTETLLHAKSILFGHAQKDQCINEIMRNIERLIST